MNYRVAIQRSAQKSLAKISPPHRDRIADAIRRLGNNPRPPGATMLRGRDGWRIRVGTYRVLYQIKDDELVVRVVSLGHRQDVYR